MKKIPLLFILVFLVAVNANGAPSISGISGNVIDGQSITVLGSGFGTNPLDIEWLGGPNGNIEQGSDEARFQKTNWISEDDNDSRRAPRYSTVNAYSGSKSIVSSFDASHYGSGFTYGDGSEITEIYATWWVYYQPVNFDGQWKMWRLMPGTTVRDLDSPQFYQRVTAGSPVVHCRPLVSNSNNLWRVTGKADWNNVYYLSAKDWPGYNQWARVEIYIKSSQQEISNGSLIVTYHRPDTGINTNSNANYDGNLMTYNTDQTKRFKYFIFQNYLGNADRDGKEKIYFDDIFLQLGSRTRVEIGNAKIWSECTYREIQIPTAWSDTSITTTFNKASFSDGENVYLFVVDEDGIPSAGYAITIGSEGKSIDTTLPGDDTEPCANAYTKTFGDISGADFPQTCRDTYLSAGRAEVNYSSNSESLNTYTWPTNTAANRIVMKWDLSALPQGAVIQEATLSLYMNGFSGTGGDDNYEITAHKIINHNPDILSCTWNTYNGTNSWTGGTNGGEQDLSPAEFSTIVNKTFGYKNWNITQMVQEWVDNSSTNLGLMLNSDTSAALYSNRYFIPSENSNQDQRPVLTIKYCGIAEVPSEPTGLKVVIGE